jgi:hypothetical protein
MRPQRVDDMARFAMRAPIELAPSKGGTSPVPGAVCRGLVAALLDRRSAETGLVYGVIAVLALVVMLGQLQRATGAAVSTRRGAALWAAAAHRPATRTASDRSVRGWDDEGVDPDHHVRYSDAGRDYPHNVSIGVDAVVYFRVADPVRAVINVENYLQAPHRSRVSR